MKAKSKILFQILTICAVISVMGVTLFTVTAEGDTTNCSDGCYLDTTTNNCVCDDTGTTCGTDEYWDSSTNTCIYSGSGTTCSDGCYWDSASNNCVCDSTGTGVACGTDNYCAIGDFCANYDNGWCCPDGTVICDDGACVNSAAECSTTNDCGPDQHWDSYTNTCVYDGTCGTGCYLDTTTNNCVCDDNIKIDCENDSYWDPATNSCVYKDRYCEPDHYWNDEYSTCKPISGENDIIYTITEQNITQGPGGCQSKEECDRYCLDPANTEECIGFAVDGGFMDQKEADAVRLMMEKEITEGPGGCQSEEACDAYCKNPENTEECVNFAVKIGFMTPEEAERIMRGGPGGCQSREECDAYCDNPANEKECISFAVNNDMFMERPKMISPSEIKIVLEKVTEPAKCETETECKIYCSSADANKELCQTFASMVIVEDKMRSITEFVDYVDVEEALLQDIGPGGTKSLEEVHAYCSNPLHDKECQEFLSEKKLIDEQILDEKIEELNKKRLEKEKMFAERIGARVYEDSDGDGISNYDELNIFHTDPNMTDTDGDGVPDGAELLFGKDPLSGLSGDQPTPTGTDSVIVEDKITYEDPKIAGEEKSELIVTKEIKVLETEIYEDGKEKAKKISFQGTAPANSFVTVYIYSTPIIVTVKTDKDGNWSYVLDKELEDGSHEIHVAITDNAGKIFAKSKPLPFVKEAAAVSMNEGLLFGGSDAELSIFGGKYLYVIVLLVIVIIGWVLVFTGSRPVKLEEHINNK